jgi:hypothetical protein
MVERMKWKGDESQLATTIVKERERRDNSGCSSAHIMIPLLLSDCCHYNIVRKLSTYPSAI